MGRGIDYGMGLTNIDKETGIRYGVINANALSHWFWEEAESDYGDAHCPKCGNPAKDSDAEDAPDLSADDYCDNCEHNHGGTEDGPDPSCQRCECKDADFVEWEVKGAGEYYCARCNYAFDGDEAFGDEPIGHHIDDGEIQATVDGDGDVFVMKSPYYTRAQFCSPCAPGACHLENPTPEGERAYCFGHEWFEEKKAPYPVYRVDTGEEVKPKEE